MQQTGASYSSHTKYKGLEETIGNIQYLTKNIIPDLQWNTKEVSVTSDNRIVVIGEATGSPVGDKFFGKPITPGSSFTIMSIDVHTVENGKIVKTYHIEDWFSAIKQLSPKS